MTVGKQHQNGVDRHQGVVRGARVVRGLRAGFEPQLCHGVGSVVFAGSVVIVLQSVRWRAAVSLPWAL